MRVISTALRAASAALLVQFAVVATVAAQSGRVSRTLPAGDDPAGDGRAVIGLTVSVSETSRDTLGVLVSGVVPNSPADRAGLNDGNRIAEINGVSLRVSPGDIGQADAGDAAVRRFARQLRLVRAGDPVTLRVFTGGRYRTVTLPLGGDAPAVPQPPARRSASVPPVVQAPPPAVDSDDQMRAPPATLAGVLDAIAALRAQIRQLSQGDESGGALADSLASADDELGDLSRRLRAAQPARVRPTTRPSRGADANTESIPGLRLTTIAEELTTYFGAGSEHGLLILEADSTWDPIRTGDVVLRINGMPATVSRLRETLDRRQSAVEILRRRRALTVTVYGRD